MNFIYLILGFLLGIGVTLVILKSYASKLMMKESESKFDFDETVERLSASVSDNEWRMPHVHDLKAILNKFGYDVKKIKVLEVCKPELANKILSGNKERVASSLMPCRIAVYETTGGKVVVNRLRGKKMGMLFGGNISKAMSSAGIESEKIISAVEV
ncbi:DUF302 domain-containing protein [Labilibacter sediminis]|nr:DUF302 domain-containing protein [Labilibacter sediminis]